MSDCRNCTYGETENPKGFYCGMISGFINPDDYVGDCDFFDSG